MLILSRKAGEEIILGNDIVIKITEISKSTVKIGIQAPKETLILRGELKEKIKKINQEATKSWDINKLQTLSKKINR